MPEMSWGSLQILTTYESIIINDLQHSTEQIVVIVWVLLLGVHYLDMLLQLKLPSHVPNQNKLCKY